MKHETKQVALAIAPIIRLVDQRAHHRHADAAQTALIDIDGQVGLGHGEHIERLSGIGEFQFQARTIGDPANKFDIAEAIAVTVMANIRHHFFDHQFDFIHPRRGKSGLPRLRAGELGAMRHCVDGQRLGALA